MTYLKKNKLIIFFFILGILQILYYWSERSNFKLQILINPFKKNSYLSYILPERIIDFAKINSEQEIIFKSKIYLTNEKKQEDGLQARKGFVHSTSINKVGINQL